MLCTVPGSIGLWWSAESVLDYVTATLAFLMALEFGHIALAGKLYPQRLND